MKKQDYYELGKILRTHGLKGEVSIFLDVDNPEEYEGLDSVFVEIEAQFVPFLIEKLSLKAPNLMLKFEDIHTIEQAKELVGCKLFLPVEILPELPDDEYYLHELIDCQIIDEKYGNLGTVKEIYDLPGQDLLAFEYQHKEILVPIKDEIIIKFERTEKRIKTKLPEGLLEVYLNEKNDKI